MKVKRFLPLMLCIAIVVGCFPAASAAVARSYQQKVYADERTGVTSTFEVHEKGEVRFYIYNTEGSDDLEITVHKLDGSDWSEELTVNGASLFKVKAGGELFVDADGTDWEPGIYRFQAKSDASNDFLYYVHIREMDYTP